MKNSFYIKFYLFIFIFQVNIFADFSIKLEDINEYKIDSNEVLYKIYASEKRLNNLNKKNFISFVNIEKYVSENLSYINGNFTKKDLNIDFEKAYFLEGKFIMLNAKGKYLETEFISEKAIFDNNILQLKNSTIYTKDVIKKKIEYSIKLI